MYVGLIFDLFLFEDVILSIPGLQPVLLRTMCLGWMVTMFIMLIRYLFMLLQQPDCFLFVRSPYRCCKVPNEVARVLKATSANYMVKNQQAIMDP